MLKMKYRFHYFSKHLNREVEEVYWNAFLNNLAISLVFIFEPIYLYTLGYGLIRIMWFYVEVYVLYALLVTLGAKFASRFGYKHSIFVANIFYVIYWLILFSVRAHPALIFAAPFFYALQKSWFWPAYNAEVSLSSRAMQRGREIGVLEALVQLAFILGPFLGGFISEQFGFLFLFIGASIIMLFSAYPLFTSPEVYSRHEFRLRNLWQVFRKHPSNFFGYWGYAEDLMVMCLWPVYMYVVISDVLNVGLVSTIATVIGTMLMLYVGRVADFKDKRSIIFPSAIFYGVTWLLRFAATSLSTVLTFDVLTKAGKDVVSVPMLALTYERGSSKGADYAIAYSVFYEFSLAVGKVVTALAAIAILASGGSIFWVFGLVGIMTLFYAFLK
jgi:MFS family permease